MKHSPYSRFSLDSLVYRDFLALDRTTLANERTLLAYGRTCLMMLVAGITLIKLFPDSAGMIGLGYTVIPAGVVIFIFGVYRYWKIRKAIYISMDRAAADSSCQPPPPSGQEE